MKIFLEISNENIEEKKLNENFYTIAYVIQFFMVTRQLWKSVEVFGCIFSKLECLIIHETQLEMSLTVQLCNKSFLSFSNTISENKTYNKESYGIYLLWWLHFLLQETHELTTFEEPN